MPRRVAYLTFEPSTYSTGLAFPGQGLPPQEVYGSAEGEEYGFITTGPLLLASHLLADEEEKKAKTALIKKYWWVALLVAPLAYVAINKGLDFVAAQKGKTS